MWAHAWAQSGGYPSALNEPHSRVEGQSMRVAGHRQTSVTALANRLHGVQDQSPRDTAAAPLWVDEQILELGFTVMTHCHRGKPQDLALALRAGHRHPRAPAAIASPLKMRNSGRASNSGASSAFDNEAARYTLCNSGRSAVNHMCGPLPEVVTASPAPSGRTVASRTTTCPSTPSGAPSCLPCHPRRGHIHAVGGRLP